MGNVAWRGTTRRLVRCGRALLGFMACTGPLAAPALREIRWQVFDFPPYFLLHGELAGQGLYDHFLRDLQKDLPDFAHRRELTSPHRAEALMQQGGPLCAVSRLRTPEREAYSAFASHPHLYILPVELVAPRRAAAVIDALTSQGRLSLAAVMAHPDLRLGIVTGRRYGDHLDRMIDSAVARRSRTLVQWTTTALASDGPRLLAASRFDAVLAYPSEFTNMQAQLPQFPLQRWPLAETPALIPAHISCTATDAGRAVIEALDRLPAQRASTARLQAAYEALLPPVEVEPYRRRVATQPAAR